MNCPHEFIKNVSFYVNTLTKERVLNPIILILATIQNGKCYNDTRYNLPVPNGTRRHK